jgi:acetylornithine aminotransferase
MTHFHGNTRFCPFNDVSSLEKIDESFAGVIVEPVQGEGGLSVASEEFMKTLAEQCRRVGAMLIIDEVQTGVWEDG